MADRNQISDVRSQKTASPPVAEDILFFLTGLTGLTGWFWGVQAARGGRNVKCEMKNVKLWSPPLAGEKSVKKAKNMRGFHWSACGG